MWFLAIVFVGALVASLLLTPKIKTENARAGSIDDMNFPRAAEGSPINLILGRVIVKGPNTLWVGDFSSVAIKKKQKTGLFSSKKVIIGHTYYLGIQLGIGIGPVTLHRITCDKDELWSGTANTDAQALSINKPNLFGGKEKGGGFIGTARFYTGGWTQNINPYMAALLPFSRLPAYRGTSYVIFEKCNIGESDQLRAMNFEASRYTNTLGFTGGKERIGDDMNPMEVLYLLFTLGWGGLDVDPALLNKASLLAAGDVLFDEENGMSLNISSGTDGADIINEVIRQTNGMMFQDPATGEIHYKLIRNDYDVNSLPIFNESNIIAIRGFTSKMWEDTRNEVRVKYTNRSNNYSPGIAIAQDLANISAQEKISTITNSYPGVMNGTLGTQLAARDLSQTSVPLMSVSIETNREGQSLRPGDVFIWQWGEYRINRAVMRVKSLDLGALNDNKLAFEVVQDEFAVDKTVFAPAPPGPGGGGIIRPDEPAAPSPSRLVQEAANFFANAGGMALAEGRSIILVAAEAPSDSEEYDVYSSVDTIEYGESDSAVLYTPRGTLTGGISATANMSTGIIPSITITTTSDEIEPVTDDAISEGGGMFFIGSELFAYEGVSGTGTLILTDVRRALLDTAPSAHANGAAVWFIGGDNLVEDDFSGSAALRVKVTPRTRTETLDVGTAPYDGLTLNHRAQRPLRPAAVAFDGGTLFAAPAGGTGEKTVTWANRSRTSLVVRDIADLTSENEAGQQTVFRYRLNSGSWVENLIPPGDVSFTFNAGATGGDTVDYEIYSTRGGLDSWSRWSFTAGAGTGGGTAPTPTDDQPSYDEPPSVTTLEMLAGEELAINDVVNIYAEAGAFKVRKADATAIGKEAHGFVKQAALLGNSLPVFFDGLNDNLSGLTPGVYYLSTTPGLITTTAPSASGNVVQRVGVATEAGMLVFEPGEAVGLA